MRGVSDAFQDELSGLLAFCMCAPIVCRAAPGPGTFSTCRGKAFVMYMDPKIEFEDFDGETGVVTTKGLYCVIFHGPDADEHEDHELLTAEGAIFYATIHNNNIGLSLAKNPTWAEPISYEDLHERYELDNERCRRREAIEDGVAERLEQLRPDSPRVGSVRRLLTKAAAMIW